MRLLVSVRSAAEAETALAGGADIIDAKEPKLGSLGPVQPGVLAEIFDCVPKRCPVSVALGDVATSDDVLARISATPAGRAMYLKLGFAGVADPATIGSLLATARVTAPTTSIVAVAYADAVLARSVDPHTVCQAAADAGVGGILLDTYSKRTGDLLSWIPLDRLTEFVGRARGLGLFTAVAGKLGVAHLDVLRAANPDVVGFRGALCVGGREGRLSAQRVRLARQVLGLHSGFLQEVFQPTRETVAERPGKARISAS
jgi:uncharacterized protein (UPF0264 family)